GGRVGGGGRRRRRGGGGRGGVSRAAPERVGGGDRGRRGGARSGRGGGRAWRGALARRARRVHATRVGGAAATTRGRRDQRRARGEPCELRRGATRARAGTRAPAPRAAVWTLSARAPLAAARAPAPGARARHPL